MVGLVTAQAGLTVSGGSISASGIAAAVGALSATAIAASEAVRVEGATLPSSPAGVGVEIIESGGDGIIQSYNRTTSAYAPLYLYGNNIFLLPQGGSASFSTNAVSMGALTATTVTGTGLFLTPATASGGAGLRLPHGTAPSSPTDGDMWTTTVGLYVRINGGTVGPLT